MALPTLENHVAQFSKTQADDDLDIPILDRVNDDDLTCIDWALEIRQPSPCPPAPPSSPETQDRNRSGSAKAHTPRGRRSSTPHHQIGSPTDSVKDPFGNMAVFTEFPPLYDDYSSMINAYQQSSFSDDDDATKFDFSSPSRSFFSDSDSIIGQPSKHSPCPTYTWNAVQQYKQQESQQQRALSLFPKPSPYDAHIRREYQPLHEPSQPPRRNISYPIVNDSSTTPLANPMLPETSACRANSWPSSTNTFETSRASPIPAPFEEKSGWFSDEKEGCRKRIGKRISRLRRAFSCGNQDDR